jgi:hypothetical protein
MILRRPKKRESNENEPGPKSVMAPAIAKILTPGRPAAGGREIIGQRWILTAANVEIAPANGVKKPRKKQTLVKITSKPTAHIPSSKRGGSNIQACV